MSVSHMDVSLFLSPLPLSLKSINISLGEEQKSPSKDDQVPAQLLEQYFIVAPFISTNGGSKHALGLGGISGKRASLKERQVSSKDPDSLGGSLLGR